MTGSAPPGAWRRLIAGLAGPDPLQQVRLAQSLPGLGVMTAGVVGMLWLAAAGVAPWPLVWPWALATLLAYVGCLALLCSGWNRRFADPSLALAQVLIGLASAVSSYAIAGAGRAIALPYVTVVLAFGIVVLQPRQVDRLGAGVAAIIAALIVGGIIVAPAAHPWRVEVAHLLILAALLPAVSVLTRRVARLRERVRLHRGELARALERIEALQTRDEATGLVNRRHMGELMEIEYQRTRRAGQPFCLALIEIDAFDALAAAHDTAVLTRMLRALAAEALPMVRASDLLARWEASRFMLLLSNTRGPLARLALERLRVRIEALRLDAGRARVGCTVSAAVVEHRAGEPLEAMRERLEAALQAARAQGGNRVLLQP